MKQILRFTLHAGLMLALAGALAACSGQSSAGGQAATGAPAASGGNTPASSGPQYADVISSDPITKQVSHPKQECHDETVTHHKPAKDTHQIVGTVIGAVVGGALGNQVGGGKGRKLATVAGAIGGGYAGKKIQEHQQNSNTYTTTERKCQTVDQTSTRVVGYRVTYAYNGTRHTVRMDHKPGNRIRVPQ